MIVHQEEPYNAEPPPEALAGQAVTPVGVFYSRNHGPIPRIDPGRWRLRVGGMAARPVELSLADLRERYTAHDVLATLQCAGNRRSELTAVRDIPGQHPWRAGATSTAWWTGVRLADVLEDAGVDDGATDVAFAAPDVAPEASPPQGFGGSVPIAKATAPEVLLAWGMNGADLPERHGAPVRVVVPGYIGARSVKWVERVTVIDRPSANFFHETAYRLLPADDEVGPGRGIALGAVALNSALLTPTDGDVVPSGPLEVQGYAFAGGDREVVRVDVSADGGMSWHQAHLDEQPTIWAWRLWRTTVDLEPGDATIVARAWDSSAAMQTEHKTALWNPKGYVNNAWSRARLRVRGTDGGLTRGLRPEARPGSRC